MNNRAYIAANLNCALIFQNNKTEIIDGITGTGKWLDGYLYSQIKALNPEMKEVEYVSKEDLKFIINQEYQKQEALSMALEIMDTSLSEEYREAIAELLDTEITNHPHLVSFIKNRFYSTALPGLFDPAFVVSNKNTFSKTLIGLYENLAEKAGLFAYFNTLFKLSVNAQPAEQDLLDSELTDNGCYAAFTEALYLRSKKKYEEAEIMAIPVLQKLQLFKNKAIFNEIEGKLDEYYKIKLTEVSLSGFPDDKIFETESANDPIVKLIENYFVEKQTKHDKKLAKWGGAKRVKEYDADMQNTVLEMKEWLVNYGYNRNRFFKQFESVVEKQLRSGHPEHLCKTCCDLATVLIERSQFEISEKLLNYAMMLNFEDRYVHTQTALLFLRQGKREEALAKYNEVINIYKNDVVSFCGKAEVLKEMGKYSEALKEYEEIVSRFPDSVFAHNGKAEALRDIGDYTGALKQYDETIVKFPFNEISKTGKLQVLLQKGDYTQFERLIKKDNYCSADDYFYLHIFSIYLIKIGEWEEARKKIKLGLKTPFLSSKTYFESTSIYLNILNKQFDTVEKELNAIQIHTPAQSLLMIHASAENNNKHKAVEELHKVVRIKRPVIYNTVQYLTERYSLEEFNKSGKPIAELDRLIIEGEMMALLQY